MEDDSRDSVMNNQIPHTWMDKSVENGRNKIRNESNLKLLISLEIKSFG